MWRPGSPEFLLAYEMAAVRNKHPGRDELSSNGKRDGSIGGAEEIEDREQMLIMR